MSDSGVGTGEIRLKLFGRTDVGQIREHNEDNFLIADLTRQNRGLMEGDREQVVGRSGTIFGVCDGMGGAAAGEVASQLAVDIIYEKMLSGGAPTTREELARRLVSTVEEAGLRIFNEARADRTRRGMGTTATVAALCDSRLYLAQVGDSRAYILRGDHLVQVTRDQSLVNQLIEAGQLTEEEAETFEHNNIILQALGTAETVQVDLTFADLEQGDVLMLCSDGLSGMIRSEDIRSALLQAPDPLDACRLLTDRANQAGGHDNITVIVVRFEGPGLPPPQPGEPALKYQKCILPQAPGASLETTSRQVSSPYAAQTAPMAVPPPQASAPEAARNLRVGQTMVGVSGPVLPAGFGQPPIPQHAPNAFGNPYDDDELEYPTSGLPPSLVGFIVVGAILLAVAVGFWLLR